MPRLHRRQTALLVVWWLGARFRYSHTDFLSLSLSLSILLSPSHLSNRRAFPPSTSYASPTLSLSLSFSLCKLHGITPNPPQLNRSPPRRHWRLRNTASVLPQSELGFTQSTTVCHETSSSHTNTHVLSLPSFFSLSLYLSLCLRRRANRPAVSRAQRRERERRLTQFTKKKKGEKKQNNAALPVFRHF